MSFSLQPYDGGGLSITQQEFIKLKRAKETILQSLRIEETFDVMMENYVELERTLFDIAMGHLAFARIGTNELHLKRNLVSRRLMNLFSSTHLYRNTLRRQTSNILTYGNSAEAIKTAISDGPNQPIEYRMMQIIRNYSQHNQLPLSSLSVGGRRAVDGTPSEADRFAYSVSPKIDGPAIAAQGRMPNDIAEALSQLGKNAEVMPLVRRSLERWGEIHNLVRTEIEPLTKSADDEIRAALSRALAGLESPVELVYLLRTEPNNSESIQLFPELPEQLAYYKMKNRALVHLSLSYVEWS